MLWEKVRNPHRSSKKAADIIEKASCILNCCFFFWFLLHCYLLDQTSKLKYVLREARYFLIKSNNHENVSLAKAKVCFLAFCGNIALSVKMINYNRKFVAKYLICSASRGCGRPCLWTRGSWMRHSARLEASSLSSLSGRAANFKVRHPRINWHFLLGIFCIVDKQYMYSWHYYKTNKACSTKPFTAFLDYVLKCH